MTEESADHERVVVGFDSSPASVRALRWALRHAARTGAAVVAVRAWELPSGYGYGSGLGDGEDPAAVAERDLARGVADAVTEEPGVPVEARVVEGHPARVLIDRAAGADLLVLGNRGRGAFAEALLGSVSNYCVHHARCPVVVVRPTDGRA